MAKKTAQPWGCHCNPDGHAEYSGLAGTDLSITKQPLLLHSCCGPCSTAVIERLVVDYDITVFFYNPCITDQEEYEKRKASQIKFIESYNQKCAGSHKIAFLEGSYEPERFYKETDGYSNEPEGGRRCEICFRMRLKETAKFAACKGYGLFTTTLTVSPHKNYPLISEIGKSVAEKYGVQFLDIDFKKKAGFQRSLQLSKEYGLYRQNYCGCEFSKR